MTRLCYMSCICLCNGPWMVRVIKGKIIEMIGEKTQISSSWCEARVTEGKITSKCMKEI